MSKYNQKKQKLDTQLNAGRDINLGSNDPLKWCPLCGKYNPLSKTFRCQKCKRSFICLEHHNAQLLVCSSCALEIETKEREKKRQIEESDGQIDRVWVDWAAEQDDSVRGMKIHIDFIVRNLKDVECEIAVYFYYSSGDQLRDVNKSFYTANGDVAVSQRFTPIFKHTKYADFALFIPHSELHLSHSHTNLYFIVEVCILSSNHHFVKSNRQYFDYNAS